MGFRVFFITVTVYVNDQPPRPHLNACLKGVSVRVREPRFPNPNTDQTLDSTPQYLVTKEVVSPYGSVCVSQLTI